MARQIRGWTHPVALGERIVRRGTAAAVLAAVVLFVALLIGLPVAAPALVRMILGLFPGGHMQ